VTISLRLLTEFAPEVGDLTDLVNLTNFDLALTCCDLYLSV